MLPTLPAGPATRPLAAAARLAAAVAAALPLLAAAQTADRCTGLADDAARLACYDTLFRARAPQAGVSPAEARGPAAPTAAAPAMPARDEPSALEQVATAPSGKGLAAGDFLSKFWELNDGDKRGTFIVRTYQPNFLTAHFTSSVNHNPSSPTHPDGGSYPNYKRGEAEIQVSLRAKVLQDFLLHGDLWFAYSQKSLWQVADGDDSRPFRASDYQPEAIYMVPIPDTVGTLAGWRWRFVQAGLAHESNGQSDPLSRSWNRVYLGTAFTHDDYALQVRHAWRLPESGENDNPGLTDYIGSTELQASWFPGTTTMDLTASTSFKDWNRGSLKFAWTHPVFAAKPDGLRWYVQLFSGYGETLLDYNHHQSSLALGFTLFQL